MALRGERCLEVSLKVTAKSPQAVVVSFHVVRSSERLPTSLHAQLLIS